MEFLGAVAVIAVLLGVGWVLNTLRDKALEAAVTPLNKAVQKKAHGRGQELTRGLSFFPVDGEGRDIILALRNGVSVSDTAALLDARTIVRSVDDEHIEWMHGTTANEIFTAAARVVSAQMEGGRSVPGIVFGFPHYSAEAGVVARTEQMSKLKEEVVSILRGLNPATEEIPM